MGRREDDEADPSDGAGDGVLLGTLETAKSAAEKLYFEMAGLSPRPPPGFVGVSLSRAGEADDSRILEDVDVVDFGGFIIMAFNESCWNLASCGGDIKKLLAAKVDFESGSGIP